ncbi:MAG: hypothetical protein ACPGNP_11645, partial [Acidimicrobiales bacterium]
RLLIPCLAHRALETPDRRLLPGSNEQKPPGAHNNTGGDDRAKFGNGTHRDNHCAEHNEEDATRPQHSSHEASASME